MLPVPSSIHAIYSAASSFAVKVSSFLGPKKGIDNTVTSVSIFHWRGKTISKVDVDVEDACALLTKLPNLQSIYSCTDLVAEKVRNKEGKIEIKTDTVAQVLIGDQPQEDEKVQEDAKAKEDELASEQADSQTELAEENVPSRSYSELYDPSTEEAKYEDDYEGAPVISTPAEAEKNEAANQEPSQDATQDLSSDSDNEDTPRTRRHPSKYRQEVLQALKNLEQQQTAQESTEKASSSDSEANDAATESSKHRRGLEVDPFKGDLNEPMILRSDTEVYFDPTLAYRYFPPAHKLPLYCKYEVISS